MSQLSNFSSFKFLSVFTKAAIFFAALAIYLQGINAASTVAVSDKDAIFGASSGNVGLDLHHQEFRGGIAPAVPPRDHALTVSTQDFLDDGQKQAMVSLVTAWGKWGEFDESADPCTWGNEVSCASYGEGSFVSQINLSNKGLRGKQDYRISAI